MRRKPLLYARTRLIPPACRSVMLTICPAICSAGFAAFLLISLTSQPVFSQDAGGHAGVGLQSYHYDVGQFVSTFHVYGSEASYPTYGLSRMRSIMYALLIYANDHNDVLPPDLKTLYDEGYVEACDFYSPGDSDPAPTIIDNEVPNAPNSAQISYSYPAAGMPESQLDPNVVVLADNSIDNHAGLGRWVIYGDGHSVFEVAEPHPFTQMVTSLGACVDYKISRADAVAEPYPLTLPPDALYEARTAPHLYNLTAQGSVSQEYLDVYTAEGFDEYSIISGTSAGLMTASFVQIQGPARTVQPVVAYARYSGVLVLPTVSPSDSINFTISFNWQNFGDDSANTGFMSVTLGSYGLNTFSYDEDIVIYETSYLQPGDDGYVPGAESIFFRGVVQLPVEIPVDIEGGLAMYIRTSTISTRQRVFHARALHRQ